MKYYKLIKQTSDSAWIEQDDSPMKIGRIVAANEKINGDTMECWIEGQEKYWKEVSEAEYYVQKGIMPEYFAIRRVKNNFLWREYIAWLNLLFDQSLKGGSDNYSHYGSENYYYGFGGKYKKDDLFHHRLTDFENIPVELTLEQWDAITNKKEIVKKDTMKEDKEIIGYKLKDLAYKDATIAITGLQYPIDNIFGLKGYKHSISKLQKAGVLDLWFEPVCREKIEPKPGDWVTIIQGIAFFKKTVQLSEDSFKNIPEGYTIKLFNTYWRFPDEVRLATKEEIDCQIDE